MGSKAILSLGLLLAVAVLISSQVAAADLAETDQTVDSKKEREQNNGVAVSDIVGPYYVPRPRRRGCSGYNGRRSLGKRHCEWGCCDFGGVNRGYGCGCCCSPPLN